MAKRNQLAYENELVRVANNLKLNKRGNIEAAIKEYCRRKLAGWIKAHGQPKTLTELLGLFVASLNMDFVEISDEADIKNLLERIPPSREPVMARLESELDDETDAITIQRTACESWERPFLAIINCRNWHSRRAYFTKWHEIVHRILEGQQLRMAFRKTRAYRPDPEEVLVDRVAASLAFYPEIFRPFIEQELASTGKLTFDGADRVRQEAVPEASLQSTVIACLDCCPHPMWFIVCGMGYKRDEERRLSSKQGRLFPDERGLPQQQLRIQQVGSNSPATDLGIMPYQNMRVPHSSIVTRAYNDPFGLTHHGIESLSDWETSASGPIGYGEVEVEAFRRDDEVWALLQLKN
ncbi:MAG: hypothetical protein FJ025_02205 [Chloroflexi bacterium]|nr:hypothetical protein [Chloroflexota bacterium]